MLLTKNTKIFITSLCFSVSIGFGANVFSTTLSDFFLEQAINNNPSITPLASLSNQEFIQYLIEEHGPLLNNRGELPHISSNAAYSLLMRDNANRVLFSQNETTPLPIASLTKLMTATIALEQYNLNTLVTISPEAVATPETFGELKVGEILSVRDLLYPLLLESSNDAATALAEVKGKTQFVQLMNEKAAEIGMAQTVFTNPTGLDPADSALAPNHSTATDLTLLSQYIIQTHPEVFDILSLPQFTLYLPNGQLHHQLSNTNQLLHNGWPTKVLGGKTGWTQQAKGTLILVLEAPREEGYIVHVILGSGDRFGEMEQLVNWVYDSYRW